MATATVLNPYPAAASHRFLPPMESCSSTAGSRLRTEKLTATTRAITPGDSPGHASTTSDPTFHTRESLAAAAARGKGTLVLLDAARSRPFRYSARKSTSPAPAAQCSRLPVRVHENDGELPQ